MNIKFGLLGMAFGILTVLGNPGHALAISESRLKDAMINEVAPYLQKNGHYETFIGSRGLHLSTFTLSGTGNKGDIILLTGQGEFIPKYFELAYDLVQRGYSMIHILDHRGQGTSERILPKSPEKGSIESFSDYTKDLETFIQSVRNKRPGQKFFLLAHSMGGGISTLTLRDGMVDAVAFSAPMLGMRGPVLYDTRYLMPLLKALCSNEKTCDDYALGKSKFNLYLDFNTNVLTHSQARWGLHQSMLKENPRLSINGPTTRWVLESTKAVNRMAKVAPPQNTPMLIFQAGEDDVVLPRQQARYCAKSKNCRLIKVAGARHEILQEADRIRTPVLNQIDAFFGQ